MINKTTPLFWFSFFAIFLVNPPLQGMDQSLFLPSSKVELLQELQAPEGSRILSGSLVSASEGTIVIAALDDTVHLAGKGAIACVWDSITGQQLQKIEGEKLIGSLVNSSDGNNVFTVHSEKVCLWDVKTGRLIREFKKGSLTSMILNPQGTTFLVGSRDKTAYLFDVKTGRLLHQFKGHTGSVESVAYSPDGMSLFTGSKAQGELIGIPLSSEDNTGHLWDSKTKRLLHVLKDTHEPMGAPTSVAFSPDSTTLLTGSSSGLIDSKVRLWDAKTAQLLQLFGSGECSIVSVLYSPDGKTALVLTGPDDCAALLWDIKTEDLLHVLGGKDEESRHLVSAVAFSPDGKTIVTGSFDTTARLWDANTGELVHTFKGHISTVLLVAFSPDGNILLTGDNKTLRLWNIKKEGRLIEAPTLVQPNLSNKVLREQLPLSVDSNTPYSLKFSSRIQGCCMPKLSPDGTTVILLMIGSPPSMHVGLLRLWNLKTGEQLHLLRGHTGHVSSVAFSPDGKTVITGTSDNTTRLWDVKTGKQLCLLQAHEYNISAVAFSPDGTTVLTGGVNTAHLWDVKTGKQLQLLQGHNGPILSVAFSPDGNTVITACSDHTARLWGVKTGKQLHLLGHPYFAYLVAFSPDGKTVITGGTDNAGLADCTARLWDAKTGERLHELTGHTRAIQSIAFSPDGKTVLTGSEDTTACLWNASTGERLQVFKEHTGPIISAAFSPDGKAVVTGSHDTTARLWNVTTGKQLQLLEGNNGLILSVAFSPDGNTIILSAFDGAISFWSRSSE